MKYAAKKMMSIIFFETSNIEWGQIDPKGHRRVKRHAQHTRLPRANKSEAERKSRTLRSARRPQERRLDVRRLDVRRLDVRRLDVRRVRFSSNERNQKQRCLVGATAAGAGGVSAVTAGPGPTR